MSSDLRLVTDGAIVFKNSQGAEAQGTLIRLSRHSVVFEVYNPYSIVQLSEVLNHLRIRSGERDIYSGKAVVTNLVSTGLMLIVSASLVDTWSDLIDLAPGPHLREEVRGFVNHWSDGNAKLVPDYQLAVSNIRNFLEEFNRWLEHGEMLAGITEPATPAQLKEEFTLDVDSMVAVKLDELFRRFEEEARIVSDDDLAIHKAFARREIHPLIMCAPFMHRTYTKPLGYAGDYEMVNMILRNTWEGSSTYARIINSILLRSGTAQAHRNRIDRLTEILTSEARRAHEANRPLRVLNIGCGPAVEVQRFIQTCPLADRTEFELLDFNLETIEFAESQISKVIKESRRRTAVKFVHRSVHDLLKQASGRRTAADSKAQFDLVYCAGLYDYLNDRICGKLLDLFYSWTAPGGLVVATNVHQSHPVRGFLEHLQEWYLILRNEKQMLALNPALGQQKVATDATGVNVFLEIRKPAPGAE